MSQVFCQSADPEMSAVFLFQGHKRTGGKIPCPLFVIVPLPASAGSRRGRHRDQRRSRDPYASLSPKGHGQGCGGKNRGQSFPGRKTQQGPSLQAGRACCFYHQKYPVLARWPMHHTFLPTAKIPVTFHGKAMYHVDNAMAAAAACLSQGLSVPLVRKGLRTFLPDLRHNPGRGNLFTVDGRHSWWIMATIPKPLKLQPGWPGSKQPGV